MVQRERRARWKDWRVIAVAVTGTLVLPACRLHAGPVRNLEPVEILQVACGIPRETVSFSLPGALLGGMHVPVWLGPFRHQGTADVVRPASAAMPMGALLHHQGR